jgi:predicted MFS family arabinose efflux permease
MARRETPELTLVLLVAAVQFVNILDFMIVMPLGPDFARALAIPQSHLGYIGGAYTAAAAISGLAGSLFLDRFDRRKALAVAMSGLVIGTALGGVAEMVAQVPLIDAAAGFAHAPPRLASLMFARVVAGLFGGPATSLAFSIIADKVPVVRRGKAMGIVMGAFSIASVLGVPAGLELARQGGWRLPFFGVAMLGAIVAAGAIFLLPPLTGHLEAAKTAPAASLVDLVTKPLVLLSYTLTGTVMMAGFILIPNISAYVQGNLGYPRSQIGLLYMAGGVLSFFSTQAGGRIVDRIGAFRTGLFGSALLVTTIALGFVAAPPALPIIAMFMLFMTAMGFRNVSYNTLVSRVPRANERARFMSFQSAVQHFASAAGAFLSAHLLTETDGKLVGMPIVARTSIGLSLAVPVLMLLLETAVRRRDGLTPIAAPVLGAPAEHS